MNKSKNSIRKIKGLIFLILVTLILAITATYAWFSTQRDVEVSGMRLNVEVAESLQISLDGEIWTQSIQIANMRQFYGTYTGTGDGFAIYQAKKPEAGGNTNYVPTELLPVSSAGEVANGKLQFVQGTIENNADGTKKLTGITACSENDLTATETVANRQNGNNDHPYLVFDMYLRNISAKTEGLDDLLLNEGSRVWVNTDTADDGEQEGKGKAGTGLEYSARVGMVLYGNTISTTATDSGTQTIGEQIRGITADGNEVAAIWEPNNKEHTTYVVSNNGRGITSTSQAVDTYGIKVAVASAATKEIANINSITDTNLVAVNTFTPEYTTPEDGVDEKTIITNTAGANVGLKPNQISKVRVYIWLEGQDPDCIDLASTGDKLNVTLKLTKDQTTSTDKNTYMATATPLENAKEITGADGQFKYVQLHNGEIQISKYLGSNTSVTIPATYDGYEVYSVGNIQAAMASEIRYNIFGEINSTSNTTITSVTISEGIEEIGVAAFSKCTRLTGTLNLPHTITKIGDVAFNNCTGLTGNLRIPEGVTNIGAGAFQNCSGFKGTLTLPSTLIQIGEYAFNKCTGLKGSLVLPTTLTQIGMYAFSKCTGLTGNLIIPEGVITIGTAAFQNCSGFNGTLTLPTTLTQIGQMAFNECTGLTGNITIPEGVTNIGTGAFQKCSGFNGTLTLPSTLTQIGDAAFNQCLNLTNTSLIIPKNLKLIGTNDTDGTAVFAAIAENTLKEYKVADGNQHFKSVDGVLFNKSGTRLIAYPVSKLVTTYEIPEGITIIDEMAFNNITQSENKLKKIILPNSYVITTTLPENYINNQGETNSLAVGLGFYKGIEEIEVKTDNTNYQSENGIVYSKDLTTLWYVPISKIGDIVINENVTTIKNGAFSNPSYRSHNSIKIPASITQIEDGVIKNLQDLGNTKVTFDVNCVYEFKEDGTIGKK